MRKNFATITGLGSYLPERILSNRDLEKMVDTSHEWIFSRSGINERRIASRDEFPSTMGVEAAKRALAAAHVEPGEVDAIIVSTMTPDYLCPSTATLIQKELGAEKAIALDISAACSGFLYGLSLATVWAGTETYDTVLVISTEKNSAFIDYQDRTTCVLFGDGAGAAVVQADKPGYLIDHICLGADGKEEDLIKIPAGGARHPASPTTCQKRLHFLKMKGKEVFRHAVRRMEEAALECLEKSGFAETDIDYLVPHQANIRIMKAIAKRFGIPWERVFRNIEKYGNTSSASIPIALCELDTTCRPKPDENLLLVSFGGGLTWGAALLTQKKP
jgi:3-oxoacyl-[acyl-carrier-protein] synthase-3